MSESIELPNDNDLPVYGFCKCGSPVQGQLMPDLHDCSGNLICEFCILGLHWKTDLQIEVEI